MAADYHPKNALVNKWIMRLRRRRSPLTCETYARDVEHFARFLGGFDNLPQVTTDQVDAFIDTLIGGRAHQPVTVRRKLTSIRSFYEHLRLVDRMRSDNPTLDIQAPKPGKRLPIVMDEQEVKRVLAVRITHTGPTNRARTDFQIARDQAIMFLFYASGLRRAEIAALELRKVKIAARELRVIGKGNKERVVLFDDAAAEAMQAYLHVRPDTTDEAFFVGRGGGRLQPRQVWEIFRAFADRSGIVTHATPHVMRHSFATHRLHRGTDINAIQELLGHESLATTGIYLNASRESIRTAYDRGNSRKHEENITNDEPCE